MHKLIKLDVFARQVLAVRSEEGWQLFYIGGDGKRRSVDDLIVPSLLVEKGLEKSAKKIIRRWSFWDILTTIPGSALYRPGSITSLRNTMFRRKSS